MFRYAKGKLGREISTRVAQGNFEECSNETVRIIALEATTSKKIQGISERSPGNFPKNCREFLKEVQSASKRSSEHFQKKFRNF